MISFLHTLIFNRVVLNILILLVITALIWFIGPLFAFAEYKPLDSEMIRWVLIALLWFITLAPTIWRLIRSHVATKNLIAAIKNQAKAEPDQVKTHPNMVKLNEEFIKAIQTIKQRPGKKNLYSIPWYIIIGPPGTGKTTIIENSGLTFPTQRIHAKESVSGIGGTRNCQWWFTEESVLIDTAGRYFSQDSDQTWDSTEWFEFLTLLKQHRYRRPINGALITLSIAELANTSRSGLEHHALTIKKRILELHEQLNIQVPTYFLLTKVDQLPGFNEFFADLTHEQRKQVWGFTLNSQSTEDLTTQLTHQFNQLLTRLNEWMLPLLHKSTTSTHKELISNFPKQLAYRQHAIINLIKELSADTDIQRACKIRGMYLNSGTQNGTVLEGLISSMMSQPLAHAKVPQPYAHTAFSSKGYFIEQLFTHVVFPEAGLVGNNPKLESMLLNTRRTAIFATWGVLLAGSLLIGWNYRKNIGLLSENHQQISELNQQWQHIDSQYAFVNEIPLINRISLLDQIEFLSLPERFDFKLGIFAALKQAGLNPYPVIKEENNKIFQKISLLFLMPDVTHFLKNALQNNSQYQKQYQALKSYLMLNSTEHFSADEFQKSLDQLGWSFLLKDLLNKPTDIELTNKHLHTLVKEFNPAMDSVELDQKAIQQARVNLQQQPTETRIYENLMADLARQPELKNLPPFNLYEASGGHGSEVIFKRKSQKNLKQGISSVYSKTGYDRFKDLLNKKLDNSYEEHQWVVNDPGRLDKKALRFTLLSLYLKDYIAQSNNLINDIRIASFITADNAYQILDELVKEKDGRLLKLLERLKQQTQLTSSLIANNPQTILELPSNDALSTMTQLDLVTSEFLPLHQLIESDGAKGDGAPLPINDAITAINELKNVVRAVAAEMAQSGSSSQELVNQGQSKIQTLRSLARSYPQPVQNIMLSISDETIRILKNNTRDYINNAWRAETYQFCQQAIHQRYPFSNNADNVRLSDFGQFFGPSGLMQNFMNKHLLNYLDNSSKPWNNKRTSQSNFLLSRNSLRMFEQADAIKQSFFSRSETPSFEFSIIPKNLSGDATKATLMLDGQMLEYFHNWQQPMRMQWPGPAPRKSAKIIIENFNSEAFTLEESGDWAWFRLMDKAQLRRLQQRDRYELTFDIEGYQAQFLLQAQSAFNPFELSLTGFYCPEDL